MKRTKVKKETKEFSAAVGHALRRAAKLRARQPACTARQFTFGRTAKSSRKNRSRFVYLNVRPITLFPRLPQVFLNCLEGRRQSTGSEKILVHRVLGGKDRLSQFYNR